MSKNPTGNAKILKALRLPRETVQEIEVFRTLNNLNFNQAVELILLQGLSQTRPADESFSEKGW